MPLATERCAFYMIFDLVSFIAGITAGGLTGALAGILYGLERTAALQESLIMLSNKMEKLDPTDGRQVSSNPNAKAQMKELRAELDSIHEEIRKMYRKTTR
jgi:gas vesicle protein